MYDDEHPNLVAKMIKRFLKRGIESRALVAIPLRDFHTKNMASTFTNLMQANGFYVAHRGLEKFEDDWKSDEDIFVQWTIWSQSEAG